MLVVGFLATSLFSFFMARASMRAQIVSNSLPLTSDTIYSELQRDLIQPIFISSLMARDTFVRDWVLAGERDIDQIAKYLGEIRDKYGTFTCFFVSESSRNYYCFDGLLKQISPDNPADEWYFRIREMDELYEINVDPDLANDNAMAIFINYRVFDYDDGFIGATGVGLQVNALSSVMQRYGEKYSRNIYLVDRQGHIMLSNAEGPETLSELAGLSDVASSILESAAGAFSYHRDGALVFLNSRFVEEIGWYLLVEETEAPVTKPIVRALIFNLIICAGLTLAIVLVTGFSINRYEQLEYRQEQLIRQQHEDLNQKNQRLSELIERKNQLVQVLCHDLYNPFAALSSLLDSIEDEPGSFDQFLPEVHQALDHGMGLIEQVRKMRAVEAGVLHLETSPYALEPLVREAEALLRDRFCNKEIELKVEVAADIKVDVERFTFVDSVVANLLSNALKFSPRGATVNVDARVGRDGRVCLSVTDRGAGIPAEQIDRLLSVGGLPSAGTEGEMGTGFGLPLVFRFVEAFGGEMQIESHEAAHGAEAHGTTVSIWLKSSLP